MKTRTYLLIISAVSLFLTASTLEASPKKPVAPEVNFATMVQIPASSFSMGYPVKAPSPYGDEWFEDQQPMHQVNLDLFWMDRNEVSAEEFALFLTYAGGDTHFHPDQSIERVQGGYLPIKGREKEAMHQLTWEAAAQYCAWAGKRLPTEAEWERAAAGTDRRLYPWGAGGPSCSQANFFTANTFCGNKPANIETHLTGSTPDGIMDLAGNVAEWTADWYDLYTAAEQTNPQGPASGTLKAVRGGGYLDGSLYLRTYARWGAPISGRSDNVGFRCVWSAAEANPIPRGALAAPADENRVASPRPYAPAAKEAEILADNLSSPGEVVFLAGNWYVMDSGAKRVIAIPQSGQKIEDALTGLVDPANLATDGKNLFVTDRGAGKIWRFVPGSGPTLLAENEDAPALIAAKEGNVFWSTKTGIRGLLANKTDVQQMVSSLDGVSGLVLSSTHVIYAEAGNTSKSKVKIAKVSINGGSEEIVVRGQFWGTSYKPADLVLDEAKGQLYFPTLMRDWPYFNQINTVSLNNGSGTVYTYGYTPPGAGKTAVAGDFLFQATNRSLVRIPINAGGENASFEVPAPWTTVGGIAAEPNQVVWTDRATGRVYRMAF